MALISCPECRRDVSDKAPACPHCGYPVGGQARPQREMDSSVIVPWVARLVAFVVFCIVLIVMFAKGRS